MTKLIVNLCSKNNWCHMRLQNCSEHKQRRHYINIRLV